MIYFIPESNIAEFEKRIAKLIRRAAKCDAALEYRIDRETFRDVKMEFVDPKGKKTERYIRHIQVVVEGDRPKFAGWNFIGTLEHTQEGNILRMVPGETAPAQYRDQPPFCEHCKLNRTRRDTFLVRHETGTTSQVGSNCLRDFLGHENPHRLAVLSTVWVNIEELGKLAEDVKWQGGYGGGLSVERHDLMIFLSYVAEITIRHGFFSRAAVEAMQKAQGPDARVPEITAWRAARYMLPGKDDWEEAADYAPTEAAKAMAEEARSWALREFGTGLPEDGDDLDALKEAIISRPSPAELSDFEHNLYVVAKGEAVERRTFGIAAYLIQGYRKANNMIPQKAAPKVPSAYLGKVGDRLRALKVTCVKVFTWKSDAFGTGYLLKMRTVDGNIVVWRTYNIAEENLMEADQEYAIDATIKEHSLYNAEKQTVVSRMKIVQRPVVVAAETAAV